MTYKNGIVVRRAISFLGGIVIGMACLVVILTITLFVLTALSAFFNAVL